MSLPHAKSLPDSVALEHNGNPLVVRKTFIDIVEAPPQFLKLNSAPPAPYAYQDSITTADLPEPVVHDEPLSQWRDRQLSTVRAGCTDACSIGDVAPHCHSDTSDVASIVSTTIPSDTSPIGAVCGPFHSDLNGLHSQSYCAYLPQQDCSAPGTHSPIGIQPWITGQEVAEEEEQGDRTTLMFRNLPESLTRCKLEELLNAEGFATRFNFLYLPADLKSGACFGYAFINMLTPCDARSFMERFQGFQEWPMPSPKRAEVHINKEFQSIHDLIERYRNSPMMHRSVPLALRPTIYCNGCEMPFPEPTAPVKPPRTKNRNRATRQ